MPRRGEWAFGFGGTNVDTAGVVAVDSTGNVIVAGQYHDALTIGSSKLTAGDAGGGASFLAKISSSGSRSTRPIDSSSTGSTRTAPTSAKEATSRHRREPTARGELRRGRGRGRGERGGRSARARRPRRRVLGRHVSKLRHRRRADARERRRDRRSRYHPNGAPFDARRFGTAQDDDAFAIAARASGDVIIVGDYSQGISFDGITLDSNGATDAFVAALVP